MIALMDGPTNEELIAAGQAGDANAYNELIKANIRLVWKLAKKYEKYLQGSDVEDLVQEGCTVMFRAAKMFDLTRGLKFTTYATISVERWLQGFTCRDGLIYIPRHQGTSSEETIELKKKAQLIMSFDAPRYEQDEQNSRDSWHTIPGFVPKPDDILSDNEESNRNQIELQLRMAKLSERDREIVRGRFEGLTLRELGERLGITKQRVDQIFKQTMERLKADYL